MAHHASLDHVAPGAEPSPGASLHAESMPLPPQVVAARDGLFRDADQHGPRAADLLRRALTAAFVLPITLTLAAYGPWRSFLLDVAFDRIADVLLLLPVLAALVALAAVLAPLARMSVVPLLAVAVPLVGGSVVLVARGDLVLASVPAALGATVFGLAAARGLQRAVWALPVLLAAGISDAQSVRGGITGDLLDGAVAGGAAGLGGLDVGGVDIGGVREATLRVAPELVATIDFVVLHVPVATGTWMLGLVDVVALGLLLGLSHLFWLPIARSALFLGVALTVAHVADMPIPVLPLLGIAWVAANARLVWRATRFSARRLMYLGG